MSDHSVKLGTLAPPDGRRDAVHVAVVPCVAAAPLMPGRLVGLNAKGEASETATPFLGVVDPFLSGQVLRGEHFWLCLRPGTTHNLRHAWSHPAFSDIATNDTLPSEQQASEAWLRGWCRAFWPWDDADKILAYLQQAISAGEVCFGITNYYNALEGSEDEGTATLSREFWLHYERYTGHARPAGALTFRCAC